MPTGLKRRYGGGNLHFVTCSCYRRMPFLRTGHSRDVFLKILGQVRGRCRFALVGCVAMPEHFHLLMSETKIATPFSIFQFHISRGFRNDSSLQTSKTVPMASRFSTPVLTC
jgi:REP element-mobilizing transposase RayT